MFFAKIAKQTFLIPSN